MSYLLFIFVTNSGISAAVSDCVCVCVAVILAVSFSVQYCRLPGNVLCVTVYYTMY